MKYIILVPDDSSKQIYLLQSQEDGTYKKVGILWDMATAKELLAEANYSSNIRVMPWLRTPTGIEKEY